MSTADALRRFAEHDPDVRRFREPGMDDAAAVMAALDGIREERAASGGTNRWTLEHGVLRFDGFPVITLVRARWGDGALPAATLDDLHRRILDLLNEAGITLKADHA